MKVLLLVPPGNMVRDTFYGCWHEPKFISYNWPPLHYYQLAAILSGFDVKVIDSSKEKNALHLIRDFNPDFIIVNTSLATLSTDLSYIDSLALQTKIIFYGVDPTLYPEKFMDHAIVIRGEPEEVLGKVIEGKSPSGVCKRKISQKILIADYTKLPFPKRGEYRYFSPLARRLPFTTINVSRGCLHRCSFCSVPKIYNGKIYYRPISTVEMELDYLHRSGYKELMFRDADLCADKEYLSELCKVMQKYKFSWICNARIDSVDDRLLHVMKRAGCHLIKFGVETYSDKALGKIGKGITTRQVREVFSSCHKIGIEPFAHFMLGLTDNVKQEVDEIITFADSLNLKTLSFDILDHDSSLENLHNYAFRSFYLRPKVILSHLLSVRTPSEFYVKFRSTIELWKRLL